MHRDPDHRQNLYQLLLITHPTTPKHFTKNSSKIFSIYPADRQTVKQTHKGKNTTCLAGGNQTWRQMISSEERLIFPFLFTYRSRYADSYFSDLFFTNKDDKQYFVRA